MKFKKGMYVRIPMKLDKTSELYSVTSEMESMIGSKQKIEDVYLRDNDEILRIRGYSWSSHDISMGIEKKRLEKKYYFDIKQLNV